MDMVTEYLAYAMLDPITYPLYQTHGAVIMRESDGATAYLFYGIFKGDSLQCSVPDAAQGASACTLAHLFEARYDLSDVSFDEIHTFFESSSSRRSVLEGEEWSAVSYPHSADTLTHYISKRRRLLATTPTSTSLAGAVRSMVCRRRPSPAPSCQRGVPAYPRCLYICTN